MPKVQDWMREQAWAVNVIVGDKVVATGRFRGKAKSGATLDAAFEHVFEMRNGKVVRFQNDVDRASWAQAWGGS